MAERIEPIEVTIQYEYIDDDLKKAVKDIKSFETTVSSDVGTITKNFNGLKDVYSDGQKSISADNPKIARSMQQVDKAIDNASVSFQKFLNSVQKARNALNTIQGLNRTISSQGRTISPEGIVFNKNKSVNKTLTEQYTAALAASNEANNEAMAAKLRYAQSVKSVASAEQNLIATQNNLNKSTKEAEAVTKSLNNRIKGLRQAIRGIRFTNLLVLIGAVRRLGQAVLNFVEASSSWIENLNLLEAVFKDTTDEALDFVNLAADNFGLDVNALAEYVATFKQMANAMGQASETGTQLSEVLTLIALDVSSLRNVDIATVVSDFTSALAGQVKPVRKYGFDITMYSIDELMEEIGFGPMSRTMSQADKQLARAVLLIRQSQDAWGDLAKTINTFANQQRVLNDQFQTSLRLLGNLALGTFNVNNSLEEAWQTAGLATKAIWVLNGALMAFNEVLAAFVPNTESIGGPIATEAEVATDALEEMENAASGTLAEFDKFNVLDRGANTATSDALTAALEAMLNNEYEQYMAQYSERLKEINMYAKDIAATILNVLVPGYREWYDTQSKIEGSDTSLSAYFESTGESMDAFVSKYKNTGKSLLGIAGLLLAITSPFSFFIGMLVTAGVQNEDFRNTLIALGESMSTLMSTAGETFVNLVTTMAPVLQIILKISNAFLEMLNAVDGASLAVYALVAALVIFKGLKLFTSIMKIVSALKQANITLASMQKIAMVGGIITLVILISELITNWDELSESGKGLRIVLIGVISTILLLKAPWASMLSAMKTFGSWVTSLPSKLKTAQGSFLTFGQSISKAQIAFSALGAVMIGIAWYNALMQMDEGTRKIVSTISILIGVLAAAISMWAAYHGAMSLGVAVPIVLAGVAAAIAGAAALTQSTEKKANTVAFANGGFTRGGLFYAGERGPEWVGRQGNTSTIMNDTQMSDIMRRSVAEGVAIGNAGGYNNNRRDNTRPIILQVNGKKFLEIVEDEGKKVGKTLARVR